MSMLRMFAAATIVAALGACASTGNDSSANPGAVSGGAAKAECCGSCGGDAKMGAVSGKSDCSAKTDCATSCGGEKKMETKMGAVSGKSGCCPMSKSDC